MSMTSEGKRSATAPLLDQSDTMHLRGAVVSLNVLLGKLPQTKKLNAAGLRACERACDARNALRVLLEEHDAGRLTLAEFGGWEPLTWAPAEPAEAGTTNSNSKKGARES